MQYQVERFNGKCIKTADCQLDLIQLLHIALEDLDMSVLDHINKIASLPPAAQLLHCIDGCSKLLFVPKKPNWEHWNCF